MLSIFWYKVPDNHLDFNVNSNEIVIDMQTTLSSGFNMYLNNILSPLRYTDSAGEVWYFHTHFNGRIPGLSLYIYKQ